MAISAFGVDIGKPPVWFLLGVYQWDMAKSMAKRLQRCNKIRNVHLKKVTKCDTIKQKTTRSEK
jgi:hypothetical protein